MQPTKPSLLESNPELAAQWHPTKNDVSLQDLSAGSAKKAWWQDGLGHEWEREIRVQAKNLYCPYCEGNKVLTGFNDLATTHPILAVDWHPTKNDTLASENSSGSPRKVWWVCKNNHEYQTSPYNRTHRNRACPTCSGKKVLIGLNDLAHEYPELAKQWSEKNTLPATAYTSGSAKKVWWEDELGHEWEASVKHRAKGNRGCPFCSGNKPLTGFNDLKTLFPDIAKQWSEKNASSPESYTSGSETKVWWQCEKDHEWAANINNRTLKKSACPICVAGLGASSGEKEIFEYIASLFPDSVSNSRKVIPPYEVDIYIPSQKIGIEFNGIYWHSEANGKPRKYHYDKWLKAQEVGVQLIQIWEDEWVRNPELIKSMLAHKLGVSIQRNVFARKTEIAVLTKVETEAFLTQNHVQGFASGSYYIGLKEIGTGTLLATLVLKAEKGGSLNILRYATAVNLVGGFTKLLAYAERTYKPSSFATFADHCVSDGGLYKNNGFIVDKELAPDYMYVVKSERKHKFGYRLKKFRNDPSLQFVEGMSERELAILNNISRIWDAGKTKYVKTVTTH